MGLKRNDEKKTLRYYADTNGPGSHHFSQDELIKKRIDEYAVIANLMKT